MTLLLADVRLVDGRCVDLVCDTGRVVAVHEAGTGPPADERIEGGGRLVLPAPAEPHAHLDKAFTADVVANPAGDLAGAIDAWRREHERLGVDEIAERAERAVRRLVAAGTTAIRTHVDVAPGIGTRAVEALVAVRERTRHLVDLQIVALVAAPTLGAAGADQRARAREALAAGADLLGGVPHLEDDVAAATAGALELAAEAGVGVDLHVDETLDPGVLGLADLARLARDFPQAVTASHCCSLGMQDAVTQARVAEACAAAGVGVVTLPQTNLYLQARGRRTAPPRGLTALAALREAGVTLAAGADNLQDPFCVVGRGDPAETAALLVMAGHLGVPDAWDAVTRGARRVMGTPAPADGALVSPGDPAELVVVDAPTLRAVVADAPAGRVVVHRGRRVTGE
ncbi:MAG: hypothetical protein D6683_03465 [Actinomyces sp.]|nr:MAG: hypothetical protein D6683_03465 [Actinomyces sp.]